MCRRFECLRVIAKSDHYCREVSQGDELGFVASSRAQTYQWTLRSSSWGLRWAHQAPIEYEKFDAMCFEMRILYVSFWFLLYFRALRGVKI